MKRTRRTLVIIALMTLVGVSFWLLADWMVYAEIGGTLRPKFELPLGFQFVQSGLVGLLAVGVPAFIRAKFLAMREERRTESGLCPKCAYPVGAHIVCTECGAALAARRPDDGPSPKS